MSKNLFGYATHMNEHPESVPDKEARRCVIIAGEEMEITDAAPLSVRVENIQTDRFSDPEVQKLLTVLEDYARYPIIEDTFPNHAERRAWEDALPTEDKASIRAYLDKNKLGLNQVSSVLNALACLSRILHTAEPTSFLSSFVAHARGEADLLATSMDTLSTSTLDMDREAYRRHALSLDRVARATLHAFATSLHGDQASP